MKILKDVKRRIKLPVFMELTFISLGIITTILIVYILIQLISLNFFSMDYQEEQIENKYYDIKQLISYTDISEGEIKDISKVIEGRENLIRIYKDNTINYSTNSKVWNEVPLNVEGAKDNTYTKFIKLKRYIILDAPISIVGSVDSPAIPLNSILEAEMLTNATKVEKALGDLFSY